MKYKIEKKSFDEFVSSYAKDKIVNKIDALTELGIPRHIYYAVMQGERIAPTSVNKIKKVFPAVKVL